MGGVYFLLCSGILALICAVVVSFIIYREWVQTREFVPESVIAIVMAVAGIAMIIGGIVMLNNYRAEYQESQDIISLERNVETEGHFVLGTGSVEEHIVYYFYIETEKGYKIDKISTDKEIYIIEDDGRKPCIVHRKDKNTKNDYYQIIVPIGTIIKEYKG